MDKSALHYKYRTMQPSLLELDKSLSQANSAELQRGAEALSLWWVMDQALPQLPMSSNRTMALWGSLYRQIWTHFKPTALEIVTELETDCTFDNNWTPTTTGSPLLALDTFSPYVQCLNPKSSQLLIKLS